MRENTKLLHGYKVLDTYTGAASIPIYQTSTFHNKHLYDDSQEYLYTRFSNPTVDALEDGFRSLEDSKYALSFSSGMAAISNVLMLLNAGEHVILPKEVYGGTCQFVNNLLPKYKIEYTFVDMADIESVEKAIRENTRMIYLETPSNPLLKVCDIKKIVALAKEYDLVTVADNTFMTSLAQEPLKLGVDIVVESVTKFINGHSDVIAGLVATNCETYYQELKLFQKNFGGILGVEDAWLIMRGMKTMGIRMDHAVKNAQKLAEFLQNHPRVKHVYYPGLKDHPNHEVHMGQSKNGGAVLSFELSSKEELIAFTEKIRIPILAVSLGGVESILSHPATMSHACLSPEERLEQGVVDGLLRLSCGIENIEDLIEDFKQALES
ncbi:PLP-dependent aspartate aminotransferase family protein [Streptococcus sp. IMAU 99125]|jgi:aluminum resistance protein|uniref:PLP-dependent aspartate aminotransferase family protein n=1 Tax=Streptococcus humanilactis TaxID=2841061 RepID=A0ABS7DW44_9STRE|nr:MULTISPECIES: PLP-dependent aspartate aminotransferase family protein [Streptococcus]MBW7580208.1 PLP-dependent aspartate aminotransferase family protein [Streptococcus humanilactis]MBW7582069.1 PLP-dependent aspartate aminotransferase family protein [Streptococcus humanilactis]